MDIHTIKMTPSLSYRNINHWNAEDSGYHTSFTPGSPESSEISSDNLSHTNFKNKISFSGQLWLNYTDELLTSNGNYYENSPQNRRGTKRTYEEKSESTDLNLSSIPTPTSIISGNLRKLRFSDHKVGFLSTQNVGHNEQSEKQLRLLNDHIQQSYPTTPVKKTCRSTCKLKSPSNPKRLPQRLNFEIHSLSCESRALQPILEAAKPNSNVKQFHFRPNQKIDIIKMLYLRANVTPPLLKIFNFLSNKDISNVTSVSRVWQKAWEFSTDESRKQEYFNFLKNVKENQENKMATPIHKAKTIIRPLMDVMLNNNQQSCALVSPPGSPRTIRFKQYTKAALSDPRKQLPCVRCRQPAKVNEDSSGEEWVECTNATCANQFCRLCKCERHPGKKCLQYDLDGPSPSKRKKNIYSIGTKKSRKNLRRLLNY